MYALEGVSSVSFKLIFPFTICNLFFVSKVNLLDVYFEKK